MTIFSRTIGNCFQEQVIVFPIVFGIFCNLIILKQGVEMQFFPNGLWRFIKNGHLPIKLHPSPPPGTRIIKSNYYSDQLPFLRSILNVGVKATKE